MNTVQSGFPSIRETLQTVSRRTFLRLSLVCFFVICGLSLAGGYFHYRSRMNLVAEGLQNNLAHLLGVGDYFQIKRQIGSLVDSGHFAGVWVYESVRHRMVSQASVLENSIPRYDEGFGTHFLYQENQLFLAMNYPVMGPSENLLGVLKLAVDIPVFPILCFTALLLGALIGLSWFAIRRFNSLALKITEPMVVFSSHIKNIPSDSPHIAIDPSALQFREIVDSAIVFDDLMDRLRQSRERESEAEKNLAVASIAQQVSHDIRSPLTALVFLADSMQEVAEQKRNLLKSAVNRIIDIANNLDTRRSKLVGSMTTKASLLDEKTKPENEVFLLSPILDSLVSEKRVLLSDSPNIKIHFNQNEACYGAFARVNLSHFKTAISNLVNNAVEAIEDGRGEVTVTLRCRPLAVEVEIVDSGKGIPEGLIPNLGQRGFSSGKKYGSGLGLHQATQAVTAVGGELSIQSKLGVGTTVKIVLPKASRPSWFVPAVRLQSDTRIVILDDDDSIHHVWKNRFSEDVTLHHFRTQEAFDSWFQGQPEGDFLYLFDYELTGSSASGIGIAKAHAIEDKTIMVTSHYEEFGVYSECEKHGMGLIPKNLAAYVPILKGA